MKIVVVHQYYLFPGDPGGSRFNEMARLWSAAGHEVTVIAGTLNYTTGEVPPAYRDIWIKRDQDGAVQVWRCHVPGSYLRSYRGRMWAFFCFVLSSISAALRLGEADVVVATSPPLVAAITGWVAARLRRRRVPLVFEVRDLWPESAVTSGVLRPGSLLARLLGALERWACWTADRVNVLTPAFRENLIQRGLAAPERIVFIPNGADLETFRPMPADGEVRRQLGWGDRFVVLYAGAHGRANALGQLLDAAELLGDRADILISCVGDGAERPALEQQARSRGLANIQFCGPRPREHMPAIINAADVGAAVLANNPTFRTVYPNKVFDYMSCERPTLLAIDGVARQLVCDQARAGLFVPPENAAGLAAGIKELAGNRTMCLEMGKRGREWVTANASRDVLAARYLDVFASLQGGKT